MKAIKLIIFIIGVLLLLNAVLMSFIAAFTPGFALQAAVAAAIILYAVFLGKFHKAIHIIVGIIGVIFISFALFLGIYGSISTATYDEDVVFVLGAALRGEEPSSHLAARLDAAIEYHRRNPAALIVVCGGMGVRNVITEAEAMKNYLVARGVPRDRIIQEYHSTSTYENLSFAKAILEESYFPDGFSAVVITNNFHLFRATRIAARLGMDVSRKNAPTPWYTLPMHYLREVPAVSLLRARH